MVYFGQCYSRGSTLDESISTCVRVERGKWTERPYVSNSAKCPKTFDQDCSSDICLGQINFALGLEKIEVQSVGK